MINVLHWSRTLAIRRIFDAAAWRWVQYNETPINNYDIISDAISKQSIALPKLYEMDNKTRTLNDCNTNKEKRTNIIAVASFVYFTWD